MFRVYDNEEKKWVKDGVYISPYPNFDLYILKKNIFGGGKLKVAPLKYIIHRYIGLTDKNDVLIFENDYIKAQVSEDKTVVGLVTFAPELSSYVILCDDSDEYFTLGTQVCDFIQVIGNVFDGKQDDKQEY